MICLGLPVGSVSSWTVHCRFINNESWSGDPFAFIAPEGREWGEEMIRVLTSAPVQIAESSAPKACILNAMTLAGGKNPAERYQRREPPGHYIMKPGQSKTDFFALRLEDREASSTKIWRTGRCCSSANLAIVTNERPAHVTFTIEFEERV